MPSNKVQYASFPYSSFALVRETVSGGPAHLCTYPMIMVILSASFLFIYDFVKAIFSAFFKRTRTLHIVS